MRINNIQIAVLFDPSLLKKNRVKSAKTIYSKNPDSKKNIELIKSLNKKASSQNLKFRKRKLSRLFAPVFGGFLLFKDVKHIEDDVLVNFGNRFFRGLEDAFDIRIVNFNLVEIKKGIGCYCPKFFDFEVFNYNFNEHRAVKTEFTSSKNIGKISGMARKVLSETVKEAPVKGQKKPAKKAGFSAAPPEPATRKPLKKTPQSPPLLEAEEESVFMEIRETSEIEERVKLISVNWSMLSPLENFPVLEKGEPAEIYEGSLLRMYYQKPRVRQVMWRLRNRFKDGPKPILRVYSDDKMLWYEALNSISGSKYIFFPEDMELSGIWAEMGYVNEKGEFTLIARTPDWPPRCLLKKLPRIESKKRVPDKISLIGATECIPGGKRLPVSMYPSGAGLYGSGAGKPEK